MKTKLLKENKTIGIFIILAFIITYLMTISRYRIYTNPDELGLIAVAAYFNGKDWSQVMQQCPYYSYGYAFLLAPIMYFFDDPITFYRAGVIVNCILVAIEVLLLNIYFIKKFPEKDKLFVSFTCFCFAMCTSNIVRAGVLYSETFIVLQVILLIYLFDKVIEGSKVSSLFLGFLLAFTYTTHQRNIGIVIAAFIVLIFMLYRKDIEKTTFLSILTTFLIVFISNIFLKNYIKEVVWLNSIASNTNDIGMINDIFVKIFSLDGIKNIAIKFIGVILYTGVATFGMVYIGIYSIISRFLQKIKSEEVECFKCDYSAIFLVLSFFAIASITAIFFIGSTDRLDIYFYGRYIFPVIIPLAIYGVNSITKNINVKTYIFIALFFIICVYIISQVKQPYIFSIGQSIEMIFFYRNSRMNYLMIVGIVLSMFAFLVGTIKYDKLKYIGIIFVLSYYLYTAPNAVYLMNYFCDSKDFSKLTEVINNTDSSSDIFYSYENYPLDMYLLQYQIFHKPLLPIKLKESFDEIDSNDYLIMNVVDEFVIENFKVVEMAKSRMLLSKEKNTDGLDLLGGSRSFIDEKSYNSNGAEGFLIYGQYIYLRKGNYEVEVEVEQNIASEIEDLGYFEISGLLNGEQTTFDIRGLSKTDLVDGKYVYKANIQIPSTVRNFETKFMAKSGSYIQIKSLKLKVNNIE